MKTGVSCFSDTVDLRSCLTASSGLGIHSHPVLHQVAVPRDDWASLPQRELDALTGAVYLSRGAIGVFDLRAGPHRGLENIRDSLLKTLGGSLGTEARDLIDEAVVHSLANLEALLGRQVDKIFNRRLGIMAPHLASTAFNVQTRSYMGLHYDKYGDYRPENAAHFYLFSVNFGFTGRSFYFLNLSPQEIAQRRAAHAQPPQASDDSVSGIASFLDLIKDEPVYRVTLQPLQAYLVASQQVLHDGMTNRAGLADVALFIACNFGGA